MLIKRILDLTQEIYPNSPGLPTAPPPRIELLWNGPRDGWNFEILTMPLHWGTHLDAPAHLGDFPTTMDQIPVSDLQGPAVVVDVRGKGRLAPITVVDLEPAASDIRAGSIVVLVTGWGEKVAWTREWAYESPYLHPDAASWLVNRGVCAVGIDHFSIGGQGEANLETHRVLLGAGVWIAEGLSIPAELLGGGTWHIFALPIKIRAASGGPARVIAVEFEEAATK